MSVKLQLDLEEFRPLIEQVVAETLTRFLVEHQKLQGKLAYSEEEAAQLLGLKSHVLRDERRRGRIRASSVVGRRVRYLREDLVGYLLGRPWEGK